MKYIVSIAFLFAVVSAQALTIDLPFSVRGSYLAVTPHDEAEGGPQHQSGVWIRSVSNAGNGNKFVARIIPVCDGEHLEVTDLVTTPEALTLVTERGSIEVTFGDTNTILARSDDLGIRIDFWHYTWWHFIWEVPSDAGRTVGLATLFENDMKVLVDARKGEKRVDSAWNGKDGNGAAGAAFEAWNAGEGVEIAIRDLRGDWDGTLPTMGFDESKARWRSAFDDFLARIPSVPDEFAETRLLAARLLWSSLVEPRGNMKREGMFMSKNGMANIWSWDHCFNAMALAYGDMDCAWDQFMVMFDHQMKNGQIPDSINAFALCTTFVKPPIHGWALQRMMATGEISSARLAEAYDKLVKWTNYWLVCRDRDRNGLCEYDHGNDSGWDNSSAFQPMPPVETPELAAYLVVQMDLLADLAERIGRADEAPAWREKASAMTEKALATLFDDDGHPLARRMADGATACPKTMLTRLSMMFGSRLPRNIRDELVAEVGGDMFMTDWGLATESPKSEFYQDDGYWLGPIWAPETMIAIDGLRACGDKELAKEVALKFCRLCKQGGFAENFDARTGAPLRDKAYTWTASAFLVIAHELLEGE